MNIYLISDYPVFNEGLISMLSSTSLEITCMSYNDIITSYDNVDKRLFIYPLIDNITKHTENILYLKATYSNCTILAVSFSLDKNIFFRLSKAGVEGYLLGTFDKNELIYSINKLSNNSKFFDREILYSIVESNLDLNIPISQPSDNILTIREKEILAEICNGLSNIEIAFKLKISENTVKKHVSNIFIKLDVKDRTQATIYAYNKKLV